MLARVAVICSAYRMNSVVQHEADRFLVGYPHQGAWRHPAISIRAVCTADEATTHVSAEKSREFAFGLYSDITSALRCGGNRLAVDGIMIVGEPEDYVPTEDEQVPDRPHEWFTQCAKVFEDEGRAVPVFMAEGLSRSFKRSRWMVDTSKRLQFPLLCGSVMPLTWRLPDLELPLESAVEEALVVGPGNSPSSEAQCVEALQCMVERRRGGETGVKAVQCIEGSSVWSAGDQGRWSRELLSSALSRSDSLQGLTAKDGRPQDLAHNGRLPALVRNPRACLMQYNDGLRASILLLDGALADCNFAARVRGSKLESTQFFMPPAPNETYWTCLMTKVEEMLSTGIAPYPVERMLLVSGILERWRASKRQDHQILELHMPIHYPAVVQSQYCHS